ncbi:RagB/SusD family nutrient uptake outer membrane protein [Parapedobacter tibetensis]|uniref:RagB/SusD family nutrient uptake outer membrane protein n=1 Tax=Parapedobacter tibetensis TaxID=2972951 RepID=UPI00214DC417|nr:RagB/SusD family nutrient uptake outer membrane protein [Parapedobacter tibetensis]
MIRIKNTGAFLISFLLLQSCGKGFLDRPPLDQITEANFYNTAEELRAATGPLYNIVWFDYNDKAALAIGDARAGNMISNDREMFYRFAVPATDQNTLLPAYKSFYKIVAQSNIVMHNIRTRAVSVSEAERNEGIGEARFMRGLAYYYLVMNWGEIPIIYDSEKQMADSEIRRNTKESIWEFIIRDFRFAEEHLPPIPREQGRLTKYSAAGMLARMYLTRSGLGKATGNRTQDDLDSAAYYARTVIHQSNYAMQSNYADLFLSKNNNSSNNNQEGLFAIQWMAVSTPWGVNNSYQAYMAFDPQVTGTGDGWGAAHGASANLIRYYMDNPQDSIRRKATFMFNQDHYPEINQQSGGLTYESTSIANVKKYIIGTPEDNGGKGAFMTAYVNTYMMRLPEVFLIAADAILGNASSTSDAEALTYFNVVRERAKMLPKSSIDFMDILQEKRVETVMEGIHWYDVMRWYYFDKAGALDYIAKQDKGSYTISYVSGSKNPRLYDVTYEPAYYAASEQSIYLPIPEAEKLAAPNLSLDPEPFDFSKLND